MSDPRVGLGLILTEYEANEVIDAFAAAADTDEIPAAWALPRAQGATYLPETRTRVVAVQGL
jgi:hypothetical protein